MLFSFSGSVQRDLNLSVDEYQGMSQDEIELELARLLAADNAGVDFFPEDIGAAADVIHRMCNPQSTLIHVSGLQIGNHYLGHAVCEFDLSDVK